MPNIMNGLKFHLVAGLFCDHGAEISFDGQHVLSHLIQDHHVKWNSKNSKDHTKHPALYCSRYDVPVAFTEHIYSIGAF